MRASPYLALGGPPLCNSARNSRSAASGPIITADETARPAHPGAGGEPAADRRRGGRRRDRGEPEHRPRPTTRGGAGPGLRGRVHGRRSTSRCSSAASARWSASSTRWSAPTSPARAPTCAMPTDPGGPEEVARLHRAFTRMLERLEAERRRASSAALEAQEEERARVARDLHDEVNQSLTGLLLRLEAAREKAPPELAAELAEIRTLANRAMQELLTLARQLRPTALDDLGLEAALAGNVREISRQGLEATFEVDRRAGDMPGRRAARRLPGGPGGALERRPALGRRARPRQACAAGTATARAAGRRRRARVQLRRGQPRARDRRACASARSSSAATFRSSPGLRWAQGFGSSCR